MRAFSVLFRQKPLVKRISNKRQCRFLKGRFLIPRDNLMRQKHWQRILVHSGLPSRFLAVSFLPALPWLDEFHYVTSRVLAYKEVKDVWKCVRYCIFSLPSEFHMILFSSALSVSLLRHPLSITSNRYIEPWRGIFNHSRLNLIEDPMKIRNIAKMYTNYLRTVTHLVFINFLIDLERSFFSKYLTTEIIFNWYDSLSVKHLDNWMLFFFSAPFWLFSALLLFVLSTTFSSRETARQSHTYWILLVEATHVAAIRYHLRWRTQRYHFSTWHSLLWDEYAYVRWGIRDILMKGQKGDWFIYSKIAI